VSRRRQTYTNEDEASKRRVRFPCSVCAKACGVDTIQCSECAAWVHRECVPLTTPQFREFSVADISFRCRRCASDDSGSAFDFVASLNRYAYTQLNYYWLCVYVLCTCCWYANFQLVPIWVTMNDHERRNGCYSALFQHKKNQKQSDSSVGWA